MASSTADEIDCFQNEFNMKINSFLFKNVQHGFVRLQEVNKVGRIFIISSAKVFLVSSNSVFALCENLHPLLLETIRNGRRKFPTDQLPKQSTK
jgi:hypothetical protein